MSSGCEPSIRNQSLQRLTIRNCASASVSIARLGARCSRFARQSAPRSRSSGASAFRISASSPAASASASVVSASAIVATKRTPSRDQRLAAPPPPPRAATTTSASVNSWPMKRPVVLLSAVASRAPARPRSSGGRSSREIGSGRGCSTRSTAAATVSRLPPPARQRQWRAAAPPPSPRASSCRWLLPPPCCQARARIVKLSAAPARLRLGDRRLPLAHAPGAGTSRRDACCAVRWPRRILWQGRTAAFFGVTFLDTSHEGELNGPRADEAARVAHGRGRSSPRRCAAHGLQLVDLGAGRGGARRASPTPPTATAATCAWRSGSAPTTPSSPRCRRSRT